MRISDWSSDVCSSDLLEHVLLCASEIRMHLAYTAEQEALRRELRQYLQALITPEVETECAAGETGGPASLEEIGRASCRKRVCQYGEAPVGAVALKKKQI